MQGHERPEECRTSDHSGVLRSHCYGLRQAELAGAAQGRSHQAGLRRRGPVRADVYLRQAVHGVQPHRSPAAADRRGHQKRAAQPQRPQHAVAYQHPRDRRRRAGRIVQERLGPRLPDLEQGEHDHRRLCRLPPGDPVQPRHQIVARAANRLR